MSDEEFQRILQRMLQKRDVTDSGCWLWTGSVCHKGYGYIKIGSRRDMSAKNAKVHRLSHQILVGPIPDGIQVDHACRVRRCFNPEHLRLVTNKQNQENRSARSRGKSGFRGVCWDAKRGLWRVTVCHNRKFVTGGWFDDVEMAARSAAALRNHLYTHNDSDRAA